MRSMICLALALIMAGAMSERVDAQPRRRGRGKPKAEAKAKPAEEKKPAKEEEEKDEDKDRFLAVTGGTVYLPGGRLGSGDTILCKNGKIVAIGPHVQVPDGAEIIDASGHTIYPGLIAMNTRGLVSGGTSTDVFSLNLSIGLTAGLTTVVSGASALKLTFGTLEDHELKSGLFETLRYDSSNAQDRAKLRAAFERGRQHLRDLEVWEMAKKKDPKLPKPDERWIRGDFAKALRLLKGESTALARASTQYDLRQLVELVQAFDFDLVIQGAEEGYLMAGELSRAGVSVIVTPRNRADRDATLVRDNGTSIENAKILHEHGVPVAITPRSTFISLNGLAGRDLMHLAMEAAFAVRGGLSQKAAVDAITIEAARMLGLDHRVGSIEIGKDADFAIADGDLLHYLTLMRWTVVNGRIAYDRQKDSLLDHVRPDGDEDAPPPNDHWPRRLGEDW